MSQSMSRKIRRQQKRDTSKVLGKLKDIVYKVHRDNGWDKVFICIDLYNQSDILVIPYNGNEKLLNTLGNDVVLNICETERNNNLVLFGEYNNDHVIISDGISNFKIKI